MRGAGLGRYWRERFTGFESIYFDTNSPGHSLHDTVFNKTDGFEIALAMFSKITTKPGPELNLAAGYKKNLKSKIKSYNTKPKYHHIL